ncbi:MAG: T9SS type A sorting domain-containing protein [Bacteroidales bacterium]|nr:T9SS type A sorting domain-containing protein [Bacteroidales bacterium]
MCIYNQLGQPILIKNNHAYEIDISGLPHGMYIIEVATETGSKFSEKLAVINF